MSRVIFIIVLYFIAKVFEERSKKKAREKKTYLYEEVEFKDSGYGQIKEKIRLRAESGYSNYGDLMEGLNQDSPVEQEYEKMQEDLRRRMEKLEDFQRQLDLREEALKAKQAQLDQLLLEKEEDREGDFRRELINGIILSEVMDRPKY